MDDENTNPEVEELKQQLDGALEKINQLTETAQRSVAELQNSKKRMEEEKQHFAKFACANVFSAILPVFDSFERAKDSVPEDLAENDWVKGIESIVKQFEQIMEQFNIKKMTTEGEKFDPNLHEAIANGPGEKDTVVEELESGYLIEDHVLRAAKVKVGDGS